MIGCFPLNITLIFRTQSFFDLIFRKEGQEYLNSILSITSSHQSYFNYAKKVLHSYSFKDEHLNRVILPFIQALEKLLNGNLSEQAFSNFHLAAQQLQKTLDTDYGHRFAEEKKKSILRITSFLIPTIIFPLGMAAGFALPFVIPTLSIALSVIAMILLMSLASASTLTPILVGKVIYPPKVDAPIMTKKILNEGKNYCKFFQEKLEKNKEAEIQVDLSFANG